VGPNQDDIPQAVASTANPSSSKLVVADDKLSFALASASVHAHSCSRRLHMAAPIVVEGTAGGGRAP
jgi:hypothetical protein